MKIKIKNGKTISSLAIPFIWAHLDLNQEPVGYEPTALPIELWAPLLFYYYTKNKYMQVFAFL